jgi:hypothetical protein
LVEKLVEFSRNDEG